MAFNISCRSFSSSETRWRFTGKLLGEVRIESLFSIDLPVDVGGSIDFDVDTVDVVDIVDIVDVMGLSEDKLEGEGVAAAPVAGENLGETIEEES